jgi:hypothetical protein
MSAMKMQKIREIAGKMGIAVEGKNKIELIRGIQKAEGYSSCFASPQVYKCSQAKCLWRKDCAREVHEEDLAGCDAA